MTIAKKELTTLLAQYQTMDRERLELNQRAAKLEEAQKTILDRLTKEDVATGIYGPYNLEVKSKSVPRCTDWPGLYAYIKETGNFDMLHKRLTETAVMARVDNNEYVPGIVVDEKKAYKIKAA